MLGTYWYTNQLRELTRLTFQLRESAHHRSDPMSLFWMHVDTAHWADLVADQPSLARSSLVIASKAIANQSLQSPRFFLWLSRIYQSLYEGNPQQALEILEADWRQLGQAYLMRTNYYRWLALTARICCDLVSLQHQPANSAKLLKDAQRCARHATTGGTRVCVLRKSICTGHLCLECQHRMRLDEPPRRAWPDNLAACGVGN
ncbi:MAG: hypothetical protein R3C56_11745 [Pirellulaceae bacterium]